MSLIPETTTWWRRFLPLIAGFLMVGVLILAVATKPKLPPRQEERQPAAQSAAALKSNSKRTAQSKTKTMVDESRLSPIEKFVYHESQKVGRPDPDPKRSFERLKAVAHGLKRMDIESLKRTALNNDLDNDHRFLSVYLLALARNQDAAPALLGIALDPLTVQDMSSPLYAEELMIRTQALEGLANYQPAQGPGPLQRYLQKQDNSFLADQARRLLKERSKNRR
ncbi:MAG: hypothetical protein AB7N80_03395 [Bdellovibrionales bacterium]